MGEGLLKKKGTEKDGEERNTQTNSLPMTKGGSETTGSSHTWRKSLLKTDAKWMLNKFQAVYGLLNTGLAGHRPYQPCDSQQGDGKRPWGYMQLEWNVGMEAAENPDVRGKKSSSGSHRSWKLSYKPALCLLFMKFFSSRFWWLRYVMCKQIGTSGPSSGTCFPSARSPFCLKKTTAGVFIHPFKIPKQKILMGKATTAKQTDFDRLQDFFFPFTS